MKYEIEAKFSIGDKVWHKNLVTNEARETTVRDIQAMVNEYVNSKGERRISKLIIYHTEDGSPLTNIEGDLGANSAYATKEECDAAPAYVPR